MTNSDVYYACLGKFRFLDKPAAEKVARLSSGRKSTRIGAYHCPVCNFWHTGTRIGKPRKK